MSSKKELSEKAYKLGFEALNKYENCAQGTLLAVEETVGPKNDILLKSSTGFAGGMGLTGISSCGALTAGIMAIGQRYGRERSHLGDPEQTQFMKSFVLSKRLHEQFLDEFGNTACNNLQTSFFGRSYNFWDPDELEQYMKASTEDNKCADLTGKVAQWVTELLLEEE